MPTPNPDTESRWPVKFMARFPEHPDYAWTVEVEDEHLPTILAAYENGEIEIETERLIPESSPQCLSVEEARKLLEGCSARTFEAAEILTRLETYAKGEEK